MIEVCRGDGWLHVHVGGFPNWFQFRVSWRRPWVFVLTREDNR